MKSFNVLILCAIAVIAIFAVQPAIAAETSNNFNIPDESQLPAYFAALGIPYDDGSDWVSGITITRPDGSTYQPYTNLPGPAVPTGDFSGPVQYVTPIGEGGWWSPLTSGQTPVPTPMQTPIVPAPASGGFTIPGMVDGWLSPLTPASVPPATPPAPALSTGGWWSPLTPAEIPVMPTPVPPSALVPDVAYSGPNVTITGINLEGKYLTIKNNEMTPVTMTGWRISNGQGKSITFIDWPEGDGTTFTFVLYPYDTVAVHFGEEGFVSSTDLYWPSGKDAWRRTGDTAYLYNPQGKLASTFTVQ